VEIRGLKHSRVPAHHFASDNNSPAHPAVMEAIVSANQGHTLAYGDDYYTEKAVDKVKQTFGANCEPFFLFTGTGANVLSVAALTRSYHAVICAEDAHLNCAECAALGVSLKEMTAEAGLDVLSLGGTKIGLLGAEAVLFFRPQLADGFKYFRKQGMQPASKMRFPARLRGFDLGFDFFGGEILGFAAKRAGVWVKTGCSADLPYWRVVGSVDNRMPLCFCVAALAGRTARTTATGASSRTVG